MRLIKVVKLSMLGVFIVFQAFVPRNALAYVDPGTTGMLSQLLYVLFYGALGILLYCLRYIKQYFAHFKQLCERFFRGTIG